MSRLNENIGFVIEITLFTMTGYLMAKKLYFISLIALIISLMIAFKVGSMIYKRGKNGDS